MRIGVLARLCPYEDTEPGQNCPLVPIAVPAHCIERLPLGWVEFISRPALEETGKDGGSPKEKAPATLAQMAYDGGLIGARPLEGSGRSESGGARLEADDGTGTSEDRGGRSCPPNLREVPIPPTATNLARSLKIRGQTCPQGLFICFWTPPKYEFTKHC